MNLKPCPFCGGKAYLGDKMATAMWTAYCGKCVAIEMHDVTRDGVINKWNTRHYPLEVMQAVERIKPFTEDAQKFRKLHELVERDAAMPPEKVITDTGPRGIKAFFICKACRTETITPHQDFCQMCGQRLDWEE